MKINARIRKVLVVLALIAALAAATGWEWGTYRQGSSGWEWGKVNTHNHSAAIVIKHNQGA